MIVYQGKKQEFVQLALHGEVDHVIGEHFKQAYGWLPQASERKAWEQSLRHVGSALSDPEIPDDLGVAVEYGIPHTGNRIDVMLIGANHHGHPGLVVIELKQWSSAQHSPKDGMIWAHRGGTSGLKEGVHPSYQAWTYATLLEDFCEVIHEQKVPVQPCAYLHNYELRDGQIDHADYAHYLQKAPLYIKSEKDSLAHFIATHLPQGDKRGLLYEIESGRIRPSKSLADRIASMIQGKTEFLMIDDQKVVYETILAAHQTAQQGAKQVVIVQGGPGTGKSVVAVNLLARLTSERLTACYITKNAAPRRIYAAALAGTMNANSIASLFRGPDKLHAIEPNTFDVLLLDEAHRLRQKSGMFAHEGEDQLKEAIQAARCAVFFIDDRQRVTVKDHGSVQRIREWASQLGAEVTDLSLSSQFRCNGSDGFMAWLDHTLGIRQTANNKLDTRDYRFEVLDSPAKVHQLIEMKNQQHNRARVVGGYCWDWKGKNDKTVHDIQIPEHGYSRQWNLDDDGPFWITKPESVAQVGCIHTCQGLEVDHIGVLIGPDLVYRDGKVQTNFLARAKTDHSVRGLKTLMKKHKGQAQALADEIILNTYRTLMTRGMKGCYVWCADPPLADYLRSRILQASKAQDEPPGPLDAVVLPLRRVSPQERQQGTPAVPVVDLRLAAGGFSDTQAFDEHAMAWLDASTLPHRGADCFVAQVVGESMNLVIPNGAWCLFRLNPGGTRQGKIVVVQHQGFEDEGNGVRLTIKRYRSVKKKGGNDEAENAQVMLLPESDRPEFEPMVFDADDADELRVVAEFLQVLR